MGKPCNAATYRKATFDLAAANNHSKVVEVGVFEGALSKMFAELPHLERLHVVDSWDGYYSSFGQERMDEVARGVIAWGETQPKVDVWRMDSEAASIMFPDQSIDFFHTDGDHSLAGIRRDIRSWLPKVKDGGIMSGDNFEAPTVAQGVKELLPHYQLLANGRLWWARK